MNFFLKTLGQLALNLNLGGSRKDALTNAAGYAVGGAVILEGIINSGLLPPKYQAIAVTIAGVAGALGFGSSGKTANLDKAQ